jgi:hypothetical protein
MFCNIAFFDSSDKTDGTHGTMAIGGDLNFKNSTGGFIGSCDVHWTLNCCSPYSLVRGVDIKLFPHSLKLLWCKPRYPH